MDGHTPEIQYLNATPCFGYTPANLLPRQAKPQNKVHHTPRPDGNYVGASLRDIFLFHWTVSQKLERAGYSVDRRQQWSDAFSKFKAQVKKRERRNYLPDKAAEEKHRRENFERTTGKTTQRVLQELHIGKVSRMVNNWLALSAKVLAIKRRLEAAKNNLNVSKTYDRGTALAIAILGQLPAVDSYAILAQHFLDNDLSIDDLKSRAVDIFGSAAGRPT